MYIGNNWESVDIITRTVYERAVDCTGVDL